MVARGERAAMVEGVITGTVLGEAILTALRRLAQEHTAPASPARLTVSTSPCPGRCAQALARGAVAALDVVQAPLDLRGGVGLPVVAELRHLVAGQRLRDAIRAGALVLGHVVPAGLLGPQLVQAGHLAEGEARGEQQRASDGAVAAELVAAARDGPEVDGWWYGWRRGGWPPSPPRRHGPRRPWPRPRRGPCASRRSWCCCRVSAADSACATICAWPAPWASACH